MANNTTREIGVAFVLIGLFLALLNPFHLWMPTMVHMIMLGLSICAFGAYAIFVMREKAVDERDGAHRMHSGRIAFLVGASALVGGIIYQSYVDQIDVWMVFVLVLMVLAKIGAHFYSDRNY
jgi:predicted MFS family arabinose efflux permease